MYVSLGYGYGSYQNSAMSSVNVSPAGQLFSGAIGVQLQRFEIETFYQKANFEGDINHNGSTGVIKHDQAIYGLAINFPISKLLYLRIGYVVTTLSESVGGEVATYQEDYDLQESGNATGPLVALGFTFFRTKNIALSAEASHYRFSNLKADNTIYQAKLQFYFDSNI